MIACGSRSRASSCRTTGDAAGSAGGVSQRQRGPLGARGRAPGAGSPAPAAAADRPADRIHAQRVGDRLGHRPAAQPRGVRALDVGAVQALVLVAERQPDRQLRPRLDPAPARSRSADTQVNRASGAPATSTQLSSRRLRRRMAAAADRVEDAGVAAGRPRRARTAPGHARRSAAAAAPAAAGASTSPPRLTRSSHHGSRPTSSCGTEDRARPGDQRPPLAERTAGPRSSRRRAWRGRSRRPSPVVRRRASTVGDVLVAADRSAAAAYTEPLEM